MRIVFLGTPEFAVPSLSALSEKYEVAGVVTQPDREKDRKGRLIKGAVALTAESKGLPVFQFEKIKTEGADALRALHPDIMVTCAYGQILSKEILYGWKIYNLKKMFIFYCIILVLLEKA